MNLPAATATAVTVLLLLAGYAAAVAFWPFVACRRCDGSGKLRSPFGRAFRPCPRCKGTGRRLRFGRRIHNAVSGARRRARQ